MKTFNEYLKIKESDYNKTNNTNTNKPMPGQAYEYYLNLFNSQTHGNLEPQHIEALKKHKENDKIYNQKLSAHRMARNNEELSGYSMARNNEGNPQSSGGPMPGQAYEYYLNRFNSSTHGNLEPQHIEALKKHKENDKIYNQKVSARHSMARNNKGNPQSYG